MPTDSTEPKRVLVIDDSEDIRGVYEDFFSREGHVVHGVENGLEGLRALRVFRPDLVILDIAMPVMDGLEFLLHLRSDFAPPLPPAIVCSGFESAEPAALDISERAVTSADSLTLKLAPSGGAAVRLSPTK